MTREEPRIMVGTQQSEHQMTRDEIVAFFDRRQDAYDNLDATTLADGYAEDCTVESPMVGTHSGRATVEQAFLAVFSAFPDHKLQSDSLMIDGHRVTQVLSLEGTNIGGFLGVPPSGKTFRVPAVFLYEFKDCQIVRERRIYDFTGVLIQIGVLKAKPV